jgi:hypothetical protein
MSLLHRGKNAVTNLIPDSTGVAAGRATAEAAAQAAFEAERQKWAEQLAPHINQGLEMMSRGQTGEVKIPWRYRTTTVSVMALSQCVTVNFCDIDATGMEAALRRLYEPARYSIRAEEIDGGMIYRIFISPPPAR